MISAYAELLAGRLSFDPSLSRCVRQEVEDHLWEAVAADPASDAIAAQRRAIANFGDAHAIATQFAAAWLTNQTRKVGIAVILVVGAVFAAMKARIAWYAVTQWALPDELRAAGAIIASIDGYAFWLSVFLGIAASAYGIRRFPTSSSHHRHVRRFFLLCGAATAALVVSVIGDGTLTALRLCSAEFSAQATVPVFSMIVEIACAAFLIFHIRRVLRRASLTLDLLQT